MHGLVDFHCHLDLYPDHATLVMECDRAQVHTLAVTTTPRAWPRNHQLASKTKYVRAALGLHPQLVSKHAAEISLWEDYLPQARYVGEVGLDASPRYYSSFEQQKATFGRILQKCSVAGGGKILTIHSVRAATVVLDMIEALWAQKGGGIVLHWFTGSAAEARRAVDLGCYFSINATMLDVPRHAKMVASLPADRLLTETDGPFTHVDSRVARPTDVAKTVRSLARVRESRPEETAALVRDNLRRLVS